MPHGRGDGGSESQEGAVSFETLRDEGQHFVQKQQHHKAIESFTKALELRADDQHCLVTRSKCYLLVGNAEASLTDAESALEQNKMLIKGLFQKAEALYQKGDFENALMFYHRGHRLRPELQEFRLGIQKSQEAINNSIGTPESVKLEANKGDMTYFYKQEEAKKQQRGAYQKPSVKKEEKKDRTAPKGPADDKTIKQLLGELYGDKAYLEKLLKDQSLTGKNNRNDMSREIKDKVCDGLEYLYGRADFWGQQKPMYARKRERDQRKESRHTQGGSKNPMDKVLRNLENIDDAQTEGRYADSLELAKNTLKIVESSSDEEIQNKPELTASLHSSMGNAYLELGRVNQAQEQHEMDLDIAKEHELEDAKSRALDNLGRVYARKGDYKEAIEVWQQKIPSSKSALESTWLYHEIGRCYLELGKYSDARDYGEKSLAAAKEAEDDGWQLHACVLVAQSEVKLGEYQAAAESFDKALELAKKQQDTAAESAITKALEEVNDKIVRGEKGDEQEQDGEDNYEEDFDAEEEQKPATQEVKSPPKSPEPSPPKTPPKSPPKSPEPSPEPPRQATPPPTQDKQDEPEEEQTTTEKQDKPEANEQTRNTDDEQQGNNEQTPPQQQQQQEEDKKSDKDRSSPVQQERN